MTYNPYAPPQDTSARSEVPTELAALCADPWTPRAAIDFAWSRFKMHWGVFVAMLVITLAATIPLVFLIPSLFGLSVARPEASARGVASSLVSTLLATVVGAFFQAGAVRIRLAAVRGEKPGIGELFRGMDRVGALLGVALAFLPVTLPCLILSTFATTVGMKVAAGLPGAVLSLVFVFADHFVVDAKLGSLAALRAAGRLFLSNVSGVLVFVLLCGLLYFGGALMCGVGMLVAMPVVSLAVSVSFVQLTGRLRATP